MPLFKARAEKEAGAFRKIALGRCVAKVMTRMLAGKLRNLQRMHSNRGSVWIQARERMR